MHRRVVAAFAAALLLVAVGATPAAAADGSRNQGRISVIGDITVGADETVQGPVITADGSPGLHVMATARFRLSETIGLEGPAGPWPAADTVVLVVDLVLAPKEP